MGRTAGVDVSEGIQSVLHGCDCVSRGREPLPDTTAERSIILNDQGGRLANRAGMACGIRPNKKLRARADQIPGGSVDARALCRVHAADTHRWRPQHRAGVLGTYAKREQLNEVAVRVFVERRFQPNTGSVLLRHSVSPALMRARTLMLR